MLLKGRLNVPSIAQDSHRQHLFDRMFDENSGEGGEINGRINRKKAEMMPGIIGSTAGK